MLQQPIGICSNPVGTCDDRKPIQQISSSKQQSQLCQIHNTFLLQGTVLC